MMPVPLEVVSGTAACSESMEFFYLLKASRTGYEGGPDDRVDAEARRRYLALGAHSPNSRFRP